MTIFDLLFILIFLATAAAVASSIFHASRGQRRRSLRILGIVVVCLTIYFAIGCLTTLLTPRRILNLREPQCFDDWCVELDAVNKNTSNSIADYQTTIRIFSRAKRVSQRENGIAFYMEDDLGRRYAAIPNPSEIPPNPLLQPGESETLIRNFQLPANSQLAGFVVTHEGGFPIQWFVIGEGQSLFHKEPITRFQ